jgi:hypothetical protein
MNLMNTSEIYCRIVNVAPDKYIESITLFNVKDENIYFTIKL